MEQIAINPTIEAVRLEASRQLDPQQKARLGQFMTSARIAEFMVSLFGTPGDDIRLLDAGAGVGSLTAAFLDAYLNSHIAVEDNSLNKYLYPDSYD